MTQDCIILDNQNRITVYIVDEFIGPEIKIHEDSWWVEEITFFNVVLSFILWFNKTQSTEQER